MEDKIIPVFERMEEDFENEMGASPTSDEAAYLWERARLEVMEKHEASADAARKSEG